MCIFFILYFLLSCLPNITLIMKSYKKAELEKAGFTGSAEPNFFQILCQICPVFRHIFPKLTKLNNELNYFQAPFRHV